MEIKDVRVYVCACVRTRVRTTSRVVLWFDCSKSQLGVGVVVFGWLGVECRRLQVGQSIKFCETALVHAQNANLKHFHRSK